jgi:hypothetical protein
MAVDLDFSPDLDDSNVLAEIESWADCARGNWPAPQSASTRPNIEPGQIWFAELPNDVGDLTDLERQIISAANAIVFDRSLTAIIATALPLGGYAEPAPAPAEAAAQRCADLARDGWSVVRAIRAAGEGRRLGEFCDYLLACGLRPDLPVSLIGGSRRLDTCLAAASALIGTWRAPEERIVIVCGAVGTMKAPRLHAVAATGLAG